MILPDNTAKKETATNANGPTPSRSTAVHLGLHHLFVRLLVNANQQFLALEAFSATSKTREGTIESAEPTIESAEPTIESTKTAIESTKTAIESSKAIIKKPCVSEETIVEEVLENSDLWMEAENEVRRNGGKYPDLRHY